MPPGVLAELAEAASLEHATLHILDRNEAVRVLNLAADAGDQRRCGLQVPRFGQWPAAAALPEPPDLSQRSQARIFAADVS